MPPVKTILINGAVAVLAAVAVVFFVAKVRHFRGDGEAGAKVWFYDQNTQRLYPASRDLIPPDGPGDACVRATVIGFQGMDNNVSQLKIAYLEKYSPALKTLLERAQAAHAAQRPFGEKIPPPGSAYFQDNTMVKRPDEASWHSIGSQEARQLMAAWRAWRGPDGQGSDYFRSCHTVGRGSSRAGLRFAQAARLEPRPTNLCNKRANHHPRF